MRMQPRPPLAEGGEQRLERDAMPVDGHDEAEIEPVGIGGLDGRHADLRIAV